jgi:MFS family permease
MRAAKVPLNELRRVVIAASVGNIIEWYDFYIFGSLASILAVMGVATALIGFVPTYQSIGLAAAFILFALRLIQGLCLGGEYGGAITYVPSTSSGVGSLTRSAASRSSWAG